MMENGAGNAGTASLSKTPRGFGGRSPQRL